MRYACLQVSTIVSAAQRTGSSALKVTIHPFFVQRNVSTKVGLSNTALFSLSKGGWAWWWLSEQTKRNVATKGTSLYARDELTYYAVVHALLVFDLRTYD
jgi:hypothetical protein